MMKAPEKTKRLTKKLGGRAVLFFGGLEEPVLETTLLTRMIARWTTKYLMMGLGSCHDVGVRGIPGNVRHGGVLRAATCCFVVVLVA